jgi:hypothetical protein
MGGRANTRLSLRERQSRPAIAMITDPERSWRWGMGASVSYIQHIGRMRRGSSTIFADAKYFAPPLFHLGAPGRRKGSLPVPGYVIISVKKAEDKSCETII